MRKRCKALVSKFYLGKSNPGGDDVKCDLFDLSVDIDGIATLHTPFGRFDVSPHRLRDI